MTNDCYNIKTKTYGTPRNLVNQNDAIVSWVRTNLSLTVKLEFRGQDEIWILQESDSKNIMDGDGSLLTAQERTDLKDYLDGLT